MPEETLTLQIVGNSKSAVDALEKTGNSATSMLGRLRNATAGFKDIQAGLQMGKRAIEGFIQPFADAVNAYEDLAAQVRDFSRLAGTNSEESSRLIQIADDLTISNETLALAMKNLSLNGITPNIENLKALSDQYLALEDPTDRARFAADKFGARAGVEMAKLLEQGSAGIDELNQGINANLILTDQAVQQARDWEIAQDNLNDTMQAAQIAIGEQLVPTLTELANNAALVIGALSGSTTNQIARDWAKNNAEFAKTTDTFDEYIEGTKKWAAEIYAQDPFGLLLDEDTLKALSQAEYDMVKLKATFGGTGDEALAAADATRDFMDAIESGRDAPKVIKEIEKSVRDTKAEMTRYHTLMRGQWTGEQKSYDETMKDLNEQHKDLTDKITELETKKPFNWEKEVEGYKTQLGEVDTKIGEVSTEHDLAMKRMMLGWIEASLVAKGVAEGDIVKALQTISLNWGLITQEEINAYDEAVAWAERIANVPKDIDVNIHYKYTHEQSNTRPNQPNPAAGEPGPVGGGGSKGGGGTPMVNNFYNLPPQEQAYTIDQLNAMGGY